MIDEIFDRDYQHARADLNRALLGAFARLRHAAANAFAVLNRIEYSSPWTAPTRNPRKA